MYESKEDKTQTVRVTVGVQGGGAVEVEQTLVVTVFVAV